jgi:small subunit ribosomal protein S7
MIVRRIMRHGKKSLATRIVYDALKTIGERTGGDALETFERAVRNATPLVEVKARRVGGATYQVPMEVRSERGTTLALRWLVQYSRQRPGRSMASKLANELMDAANETGNAIRKREETHRMAEANKAFAHYRY